MLKVQSSNPFTPLARYYPPSNMDHTYATAYTVSVTVET